MKNRFLTLAMALAIASTTTAYATEPLPIVPTSSSTSGADAAATAAGGTVNMAPINVAPVQTANPVSTSGADAAANATNGPISNTATTGPSTATANPVANATGTATANPIVSPTISPTITGGNSSATGGNATGGNASLQNAGNATLNGAVSGTNTLNGNVTGTNTNNVRNDLTNQVGVKSDNTNTLNGGSVVDNSKTTNSLVGGATTATGTANVNVGDQVLHNTTNVNASGGQGGVGGKGGESSSTSTSSSASSVKDSGNSQSTSKVENSGNSQSGSSSASSSQGGSVKDVGNVSSSGNSSVVISNPKPLPPAPGVVVPNSSAPTLFNQYGLPANAKGVDLALRFMRACPSTYVKGIELREVREEGASGLTNLIFTPHSNYAKYNNKGDVQESQVVEIPDNAKVGEHRYLCLGLIQSEARAKNASEVPIQTVVNDAVRFTGDALKGFTKINLVLIPKEALSVNMGLNADGKGFGISPGASGMLGSMLATLAGGFSMNTGYTFPAAQLGGTFIVVAEGDFPDGAAHIDFAPAVIAISEEQKQLNAMRNNLAQAQAEAATAKQQAAAAKIAQHEAEAERFVAEANPVVVKAPKKHVKRISKSPTPKPCTPCAIK